MIETTQIVLIIAVTVLIALFIFRRQLKDFVLRIRPGGLDAQLSTHSPQPGQESSSMPTVSRGVKISGNKMVGWLQRIFVRHDQAEVSDSVMVGGKQDITAVADSPLVAHLYQQFTLNFSVNDFRALCVNLGQDYAALPGAGLEGKTRALLTEFERQQRLPQLVDAGRRIHPELPWEAS
jgi:hypothetical protein